MFSDSVFFWLGHVISFSSVDKVIRKLVSHESCGELFEVSVKTFPPVVDFVDSVRKCFD